MKYNNDRVVKKIFIVVYVSSIIYCLFLLNLQRDIAEWAYSQAIGAFLLAKSFILHSPVEEVFSQYFGQYATGNVFNDFGNPYFTFIINSFLSAIFYLFFTLFHIDLITSQIIFYFFIWSITALCAYYLGKALYNNLFGLIFASLLTTLPYFNVIIRSGWTQIAIIPLCGMLGAMLTFKAHSEKIPKWLFVFYALLISLSLTTKYTGSIAGITIYGSVALFTIILIKSLQTFLIKNWQLSQVKKYHFKKWYCYILFALLVVAFVQGVLYFYQMQFSTDINTNIVNIFQSAFNRVTSPPDHSFSFKLGNFFNNYFYQDGFEKDINMTHDQTWYYYKPLIPIWYSVFIIPGLIAVVSELKNKCNPISNIFLLLTAAVSVYFGIKYEATGRTAIIHLPWFVLLSAKGIVFISEKVRIGFFTRRKGILPVFMLIIMNALSIYDFNTVFIIERDEQKYIWSGITELKKYLRKYESYYLINYSHELQKPELFYLANYTDAFIQRPDDIVMTNKTECEKFLSPLKRKYGKVFVLVSTDFNYFQNLGISQHYYYPKGPEGVLYDHRNNCCFFEKKPVKIVYNRNGFPKFYLYEADCSHIFFYEADSPIEIYPLDNLRGVEIIGETIKIALGSKEDREEIIFPQGNTYNYIEFDKNQIHGEIVYPIDFSSRKELPGNTKKTENIKHRTILEDNWVFGSLFLTVTGNEQAWGVLGKGETIFDYKITNAAINGFETFNLFNIFNDLHKKTEIKYSYSVNRSDNFNLLTEVKSDGTKKYSLLRDRMTGDSQAADKNELRELIGWFQISGYSKEIFTVPVEQVRFRYQLKAFKNFHAQVNSLIHPITGGFFTYIKLQYTIKDFGEKSGNKLYIYNNKEADLRIKLKLLLNTRDTKIEASS